MAVADFTPIEDWDAAYANGAAIRGSEAFPESWARAAAGLRSQLEPLGRARLDQPYGEAPRQRFDLFLPETAPRGLAVYVHGGYWQRFDKSFWSHLAVGPLRQGFAVAVPSYTLCPEARIAAITGEIGRFLEVAAVMVAGPVVLAGHSAGGHLVSRLLCRNAPLDPPTRARIRRVVSISGVHDLRPLLRTRMNAALGLSLDEARAESPALLEPCDGADITCWVGADELPEFIRQNRLLATLWHGLGARVDVVEAAGRHHFDVVAELAESGSRLTRTLCA